MTNEEKVLRLFKGETKLEHPDLENVYSFFFRFDRRAAADVLAVPGKQRPIKPQHVQRLANDMITDQWIFNGRTIVIDRNWHCIDGQHTLNSFLKSNLNEIVFLVVIGVDPGTFEKIDDHGKRSGSDTIYANGITEGHVDLSAVARTYLLSTRGIFSGSGGIKDPKNYEISAIVKQIPGLRVSSTKVGSMKKILRTSIAGWLHFEYCNRWPTHVVDSMFDCLRTGADLDEDDPILLLRDRLISMKPNSFVEFREERKGSGQRFEFPRTVVVGMCVKAMNDHLTGRRYKTLRTTKSIPKIASPV